MQQYEDRLVYIIEKFPSPTEYFILNEIIELERRGIKLYILVLHKQEKYLSIPELRYLCSPIIYLPKRYYVLGLISFFYFPFLFHRISKIYFIESNRSRMKYLRDCCISFFFLHKLRNEKIKHIHAHFAYMATDIAQILSGLLDVKYSITVHAQDIFTNNNKIRQISNNISFIITCTKFNGNYLNNCTENKLNDKIFVVYHGIDISKWASSRQELRSIDSIINIISIARLVEKKGLIYLLKAINILLQRGTKINCRIIGEGTQRGALEDFIKQNQLADFIQIYNFMSQGEIIEYFALADIFVLPCIVALNNDMDGLPNVILESMAVGVPVIATPISAITEVIENRVTGILVEEKNEYAIANAIVELKNNTTLLNAIERNGKVKINNEFAIEKCTDRLVEIFEHNIPLN